MRFTLTYDGPLSPKGRAREKHAVREHLHAQIKELWTHRPLAEHREWLDEFASTEGLWRLISFNDHHFAPLVSDKVGLLAELDILMLRLTRVRLKQSPLVNAGHNETRSTQNDRAPTAIGTPSTTILHGWW